MLLQLGVRLPKSLYLSLEVPHRLLIALGSRLALSQFKRTDLLLKVALVLGSLILGNDLLPAHSLDFGFVVVIFFF